MIVVTGCAGFIGSNLVDRLLLVGKNVVGIDNFSTGHTRFLSDALKNPNFKLIEADLLNCHSLSEHFKGAELVYHLAANADVRFGLEHPRRDLEQNTIVTFNVLEAMRESMVGKIAFSSTGSIYGEAAQIPTSEDEAFPVQTSLYGASKLACEGMIQAYAEGYGIKAWIFRFVSVLGERYTHGHVYDFYNKLKADPTRLEVLGDGSQRKSYLYVQDCLDAMICAIENSNSKVNIFNLGVDGYCTVNDSISWICEELGVSPSLHYTGGNKGWIGDNPFIYLDTSQIRKYGWNSDTTIKDGVVRTVRYLRENEWVFSNREDR